MIADRPMRAFFLGPALSILALTAGCSHRAAGADAPAAGAPVKIRFQTDWFPEPEHGGYYQALAKGFYAAEGLDVTIVPGGPSSGYLAAVATGRADLGMGNGDDVITAVARGVPVRIVAAEMEHDAQGILFHAAHPVLRVADLDGKVVMAGPGSVWVQVVQKVYGVHFQLLPLAGDLARFMNDPAFIQQCFVTNEPYFARARGADPGAMLTSQLCPEYDPYRVIFVQDDYLAHHPDVVRRFVRASVRGWIDYLTGDPAPAVARLRQLRPDLPADFFPFSLGALRDYQLVLGNPAKGERAGLLTRERLQREIDLLRRVGVLDRPVTVDDVADLEFVPPP
ncbi:MAG TPA: ABC transporter substrate-binding protein [Opitutaceae bacterium]|nr:ABC transporter substrate-binding protein [Opitutaceae bacterium]